MLKRRNLFAVLGLTAFLAQATLAAPAFTPPTPPPAISFSDTFQALVAGTVGPYPVNGQTVCEVLVNGPGNGLAVTPQVTSNNVAWYALAPILQAGAFWQSINTIVSPTNIRLQVQSVPATGLTGRITCWYPDANNTGNTIAPWFSDPAFDGLALTSQAGSAGCATFSSTGVLTSTGTACGGGGGAATVVQAGTSGNVVVTNPTSSPETYAVDLNSTLLWVGVAPSPSATPAGDGSFYFGTTATAGQFTYAVQRADQGGNSGLLVCASIYGSACTSSTATMTIQSAGDFFVNQYTNNATVIGQAGASSSAAYVQIGGYHNDASGIECLNTLNTAEGCTRLTSNSGEIACTLSAGACTTAAIAPGTATSKCMATLDVDDSTAALTAANVGYSVTNETFTIHDTGGTGAVAVYYLCP